MKKDEKGWKRMDLVNVTVWRHKRNHFFSLSPFHFDEINLVFIILNARLPFQILILHSPRLISPYLSLVKPPRGTFLTSCLYFLRLVSNLLFAVTIFKVEWILCFFLLELFSDLIPVLLSKYSKTIFKWSWKVYYPLPNFKI